MSVGSPCSEIGLALSALLAALLRPGLFEDKSPADLSLSLSLPPSTAANDSRQEVRSLGEIDLLLLEEHDPSLSLPEPKPAEFSPLRTSLLESASPLAPFLMGLVFRERPGDDAENQLLSRCSEMRRSTLCLLLLGCFLPFGEGVGAAVGAATGGAAAGTRAVRASAGAADAPPAVRMGCAESGSSAVLRLMGGCPKCGSS